MAPAARAASDLRARETHPADVDSGGRAAANDAIARTTPGRSALAVYRRARARPGPPLRSGPTDAGGGLDPPSARPRLGIYRIDREGCARKERQGVCRPSGDLFRF